MSSSAFNNPFIVLATSIFVQCLAAYCGHLLRPRERSMETVGQGDLDTIDAAALTLLGLIIGFTFSMAVGRYDQRKNYEEAEANAIGTEYSRADLLPDDTAAKLRALLSSYIDQRIRFYETLDQRRIGQIDADTAVLQKELWVTGSRASLAQPTPITALVVSGMNDVLNSQGYTQAAWLNRIPVAAWTLMELIAIACNLLLGYKFVARSAGVLVILPVITSIAFFLIADIDSPRNGVIRVIPQNLILQSQAMKAQ
jgi:hypothetical protein